MITLKADRKLDKAGQTKSSLRHRQHRPASLRCVLAILGCVLAAPPVYAQLSFTSAVALALRNNPRVKMAEDDVRHAEAAVADAKDQYVPSVTANGGLGRAYGITLNVPTIFTLNTQSLVYSPAQRYYLRSARAALESANDALVDVRAHVEEDTANAFITLHGAELRHAAISDEHEYASKLVTIVEGRTEAGLDSSLDLKIARRTELQVRLQQLSTEDEVDSSRELLAQLIGIPSSTLVIAEESIPSESALDAGAARLAPLFEDPSMLSLEANARARQDQAFGDSRYSLKPQLLFQAQYGRISPIDNVTDYYNLQGHYNVFEAGVAIVFPLLDKSRSARARESLADASHALHDEQNIRSQQLEARDAQRHSVLELSVRSQLADVELDIAQDQLTTMLAEISAKNSDFSGRPMTAKDEQTAHLDERSKFVDVLNAREQLEKAQITMMRQSGTLDDWLASLSRP